MHPSESLEISRLKAALEQEKEARLKSEEVLVAQTLELKEASDRLIEKFKSRNSAFVESELRYRELVEAAQDIIFNTNTGGYILYTNRSAEELFGRNEAEIVGQHFTEFIPQENRQEVVEFYENFRDNSQNNSYFELPIITKTNGIRWIGQNVRRLESNDKVEFTAIARDITDRVTSDINLAKAKNALVKSEIKYRSMIENMDLGILEVDQLGIITDANDQFCLLVGYSRDELIGQNADSMLVVEEFKSKMDEQHRQREAGDASTYEIKIRRKDLEEIWVVISGTPYYDEDGDLAGATSIHYGISDQKKLEEQLKEAISIAHQAQQAEQMFTANMSHEIRTPLNAIIGMSHLLNETKLSSEQGDLVTIILHSSNLLQSLINDVLDISKIDSGSVVVRSEDFDLIELLQNIKNTFSVKAREKNIEVLLNVEGELVNLVHGDALILNQILMNLVGNAEKFTHTGEIIMDVKLHPSHGNISAHFRVVDTGIGMTAHEMKHIFDKFQQASTATNKKYGGTGLGLTITKKLLNLLNSDIEVKSEKDKGSTFTFNLTLKDSGIVIPKKGTRRNEWMSYGIIDGRRILVAEDNKLNQKYLSLLLDKAGVHYDIAENGLQAVDLANKYQYHLILMDIQMPEMDGLEATHVIRREGLNSNTPIIGLTAMTTMKNELDAEVESELDDLLSKPYTPNELLALLNQYLTSHNQSVIPTLDNTSFQYTNELNASFLVDSYGDDIEGAIDIFETFLANTDNELAAIKLCVAMNNQSQARKIVHRIKPTFKMVGLEECTYMCSDLEKWAETDWPLFQNSVPGLFDQYKAKRKLVDKELNRMRRFIEN